MDTYKTTVFSCYDIFVSNLEQLEIRSKTFINTINPYSFLISRRDFSFKKALLNSDILLPDGIGIVAALKILSGRTIRRITGSDLHTHLLKKLNKEQKTCFYLGSCQNTLNEIKKRLSHEYPHIKAGFYSPPFVSNFNNEQNSEMLRAINSFKPDVLFIGMTAPKQEKWAYLNRELINAKMICSIGAVFDFYAGTVVRSGKVWIDLGLEWLPRLIKNPKHLWKRTLYYGPKFIFWVVNQKAKQIINPFYSFILKGLVTKNVLVLGYNKIAKKVIEHVEVENRHIKILGLCEDFKHVEEVTNYPVVSEIENVIQVAMDLKISEIYSTLSQKDERVYEIMQQADTACIRFKVFPDYYQSDYYTKKQFKDLPVFLTRNDPLEKLRNRIIKRLFDASVSLLVIIFILSWLIPIIGLLIFLDSPGPIFFLQYRSGRSKKPFRCIKFRSMHINNDSDTLQAVKNDPRFTRIGKFLRYTSIDELPQFMNVLMGTMSLVGPRPHMLKHSKDFSELVRNYPTRYFIKPGITGWAQVKSYRGEITNADQVKERSEHDIWYIENWNLLLDVRIIGITIFRKFKGEKDAF